jgi:hypothetical protein
MAGPSDEEKEERGFKVIDRRGGSEDAAPEPESPKAEPEPPKPEPPKAGAEPAAPAPDAAPPPTGELPKIDFATFVLSLFTSALYQMGLAPDPASGEKAGEPNLLLARQTIDTLEMLEAKTRGNLDPDEAGLLENALFELRMRFVELSK